MAPELSKKRKLVRDGVYYAELYEFLKRELAEDGFAGVTKKVTPTRTEIIIQATKTKEVVGEGNKRIRELTSLIAQRFKYQPEKLALFVDRVKVRGLSAMAQTESLRFKLLQQLPIRRAAMGIIRYVLESGAKGCEVIVSGKIRGQRGKTMKFRDGYMVKSGDARRQFVDECVRHVYLRAGCIGVQVRIMLPPEQQPGKFLPDVITVLDAKEYTVKA
jgi:small subunit ribosomal protein S3e